MMSADLTTSASMDNIQDMTPEQIMQINDLDLVREVYAYYCREYEARMPYFEAWCVIWAEVNRLRNPAKNPEDWEFWEQHKWILKGMALDESRAVGLLKGLRDAALEREQELMDANTVINNNNYCRIL